MTELYPVLFLSLLLAFLSEKNSSKRLGKPGESEYITKDSVFYLVMIIIMAVFVGLRTQGNDTSSYLHMYDMLPSGMDGLNSVSWLSFAQAPGYRAVSIIFKTLGFSPQDYLMAFALFTVPVYLWFVRKYTNSIFFSVFFVFTMGIYTFAMAAIKQTTAVAILMLATDKALQKKYISFLILIAIAMTFHAYSFMFLIIPFLDFKPWSRTTIFFLAGTAFVAVSFNYLLAPMLSLTSALGAEYSEEDMTQQGVNIFRVLVVWVPVFLSYLQKDALQKMNSRKANIFINATMINAMIMFIGLFGTANYFARLANYFLFFQAVSLPLLLDLFDVERKTLLTAGAIAGYSGFFYYEQVLANITFDFNYDFISFSDYLNQLF